MNDINTIAQKEPDSTDEQDGATRLRGALGSLLVFVLLCAFNFGLGALQFVWEVGLTEAWGRYPVLVLLAAIPVGLVLAAWVNGWLSERKEEQNPFAQDWSGRFGAVQYGYGGGGGWADSDDSCGDFDCGDCGD